MGLPRFEVIEPGGETAHPANEPTSPGNSLGHTHRRRLDRVTPDPRYLPLAQEVLVKRPRRRSPFWRAITAPIPRLHTYRRIFLLLYPLSPTTRSGRMRGFPCPTRLTAPVSISVLKTVCSCRCPAVISSAMGLPPPSARRWILVLKPPLLRPSASSVCSAVVIASPVVVVPLYVERGRKIGQ